MPPALEMDSTFRDGRLPAVKRERTALGRVIRRGAVALNPRAGRRQDPARLQETDHFRGTLTVLAVDTARSGLIADIDPTRTSLSMSIDHVRRAVEKSGGILVSDAGDGGLAVFGWPNSLEDHADKACEAAWRIQDPTTRASQLCNIEGRCVQFRVGVHSGLVSLRSTEARRAGRDQPAGWRRRASRGGASKKRPSRSDPAQLENCQSLPVSTAIVAARNMLPPCKASGRRPMRKPGKAFFAQFGFRSLGGNWKGASLRRR